MDYLNGLEKNDTFKSLVVTDKDNIDYYNKKLLKYGLMLIKNGSNNYGITDYSNYQEGLNLVSCKYSSIKFIESLRCLIVTDAETNKQGVLKLELNGNKSVKDIIHPIYQEIQQLSEDGTLYLIRENDKYGILKITENGSDVVTETVLKTEYQTIGIPEYSKFQNMETRYMINRKYIPIKSDNKWGLASLEGKIIITPYYDLIGCDKANNASGSPVVCVPDLKNGNDAIVFGIVTVDEANNNLSTEKYILMDVEKKVKIGYDAVEIYSVIDNNENVYYMKVEAADQSVHKLDIYRTYGENVKKNSGNSTQESQKQENNNSQSTQTTSTDGQNGGTSSSVTQSGDVQSEVTQSIDTQ